MFRRGVPGSTMAVGLAVATVCAGLLYLGLTSNKGVPFKRYRYVEVTFDDLPPAFRSQADVKVRGMRVGQVKSVKFEQGEPRVRLQLGGGFPVFRDAKAELRSRSNLGAKYVELDPGTPAAGPLGDAVIPKARTRSLTELDQVLDALDPKTRGALGSTVRELGAGIGGRGGELADFLTAAPDLVGGIGTVSGVLSSEDARLASLLIAADQLTGRLAGRGPTLERLSGQLTETLSALSADGALRQTLDRLPSTLDALTPALSDVGSAASSLTPVFGQLRSGATALEAATPTLRGTLQDAPPVLRKIPGVAGLAVPGAEKLTATLRDARPLAAKLPRTLSSLAPFLGTLAPYGPEANTLVDRLVAALSEGDENGQWLRILLVGEPDSQTPSGVPPPVRRNPYPAPGQAGNDGRHQPSPAAGGPK